MKLIKPNSSCNIPFLASFGHSVTRLGDCSTSGASFLPRIESFLESLYRTLHLKFSERPMAIFGYFGAFNAKNWAYFYSNIWSLC